MHRRDLFKRTGNYDLRAYTQLKDGLSQGFVLVRHHTSAGVTEKVFLAGNPAGQSSKALAHAITELEHLAILAAKEAVPMNTGEQSI